MFENLIESTPARERSFRSSLLSLACHAAIAALAVMATRAAVDATPAPPAAPDVPYVHLPPARPARARPSHSVAAPSTAPRFATIAVPTVVSIGPPPIQVDGPSGETLRHLLGMPDHDPTTPEGPPLYPAPSDSIHLEGGVDEPARRLSGPTPDYPGALRVAGIEGTVVLQLIVDSAGHVEPGSIKVRSSSHAAFEAAAVEALSRARFVPARLRGHPVRQLVQQSVRFKLD